MQGDFGTWGASLRKTYRFVRIYEELAYSLPFVWYDRACNKVLQKFHVGANAGMSLQLAKMWNSWEFKIRDAYAVAGSTCRAGCARFSPDPRLSTIMCFSRHFHSDCTLHMRRGNVRTSLCRRKGSPR